MLMTRTVILAAPALLALLALPAPAAAQPYFRTSDACLACHNGLTTPAGEDVSLGLDWRASMMANAARDPYWQAGVRRETLDHPSHRAEIEDECSICHMPMARFEARAAGRPGVVFGNLVEDAPQAATAQDGVSCSLCHQLGPERLGTPASFTGGFVIDTRPPWGQRRALGPYRIERGLERVMRSAAELSPSQATHLGRSEVCATCHTLITQAYDKRGRVVGSLPEQVPYLEWQRSAFRDARSCQSCHMPVVVDPVPIASVLGAPRAALSRHVFRAGNFFIPRLLNRHRVAQQVTTPGPELEAAHQRAVEHLQGSAASLRVEGARVEGGKLVAEVVVRNLAGHKLPTAYPSRRAWLHVTVRDASGRLLFESGALTPQGAIRGNANDEDARRFEPHYRVIERPDQVQIYEPILADSEGKVTTSLLSAVSYLKDNRVLPRGFAKAGAPAEVAVRGEAAADADFLGGADRVRYQFALHRGASAGGEQGKFALHRGASDGSARGPLRVEAELWYQPIGYRWAENLRGYRAEETSRFTSYYRAASGSSAVRLARATARCAEPPPAPAPPGPAPAAPTP